MTTEQDRVIVEDGVCVHCVVHVKRVHHRDFPEVQAECGSVAEAVAHLVNMLATSREGARSGWQRQAADLAIGDVNAYLEGLIEAEQQGKAVCRCGARPASRPEMSTAGPRPTA